VPTATADDGTALFYETTGEGETVVFLNDVGFGAWLWGWQHAALAGPYEAVVFDPRGVGRSDGAGSHTVERLAADCETVLAAAGARRAHLVGAGLGGMAAVEYAREYGRARSLVLLGTTLDGSRVDPDALERMTGDGPAALEPCLTPAFREANPDVVEGIGEWRASDDAPPAVRAAQSEAVREYGCESPYEVTVPALLLHGTDDPVVPADAGRALAAALPEGEFRGLAGRHLPFVERSRAANDAIAGFLETVTE
jgi:pimeloyl-ACP methyl ester carboxylesterase